MQPVMRHETRRFTRIQIVNIYDVESREESLFDRFRSPEETTLQNVPNLPGAFSIQGSNFATNNIPERTNRNNTTANNEEVLQAEVVPVVSDAFPVQELVVDGRLEKWIDFANSRTRALIAVVTSLFVALLVAIVLLSNPKRPLVVDVGCGNRTPLTGAANLSRCFENVEPSMTPSTRTNSETLVPSDAPTVISSHQPTISPTKRGWTMMYASANVTQNILTSDFFVHVELSGDGLHMIVESTRTDDDTGCVATFHVVEWTVANGWESVFDNKKEYAYPSKSSLSISYNGTTFGSHLFGSLRVYEELGIDHRNKPQWQEHVLESPSSGQFISLLGDGNRFAILQTDSHENHQVVIYDYNVVNNTKKAWTQTAVIDCGNETKVSFKMSSDGSTLAMEEFIGVDKIVIVQVLKYDEVESSWLHLQEHLQRNISNALPSISGDGNTIAFDTGDPVRTQIFRYNESLSIYEWNMDITKGSLPSLSGSGTRVAVAFTEKREVRLYDILGDQLAQIGKNIDPCNEGKLCDIESLSLSYNGGELAVTASEDYAFSQFANFNKFFTHVYKMIN